MHIGKVDFSRGTCRHWYKILVFMICDKQVNLFIDPNASGKSTLLASNRVAKFFAWGYGCDGQFCYLTIDNIDILVLRKSNPLRAQ